MDLIEKFLEGDFSQIAGTELDLNLAIAAAPINTYLASFLNENLRRLEIECLTNNQAVVKVTVQKGASISREFLVEIEGGMGPDADGVVFLHIRKGFKWYDGVPLLFTNTLNDNLPNGVTFVREFAKDRFRIGLEELFGELGVMRYFPLMKEFRVRTQNSKFRIAIALSADSV